MLAAFAAAPAFAQNIAVVNGTPIPTSRADALVKQLVAQGQQDSPQLQQAVREELINREILMQEAAREGTAQRPEVKAQIAVAQQTVVLRSLIENFVKTHPVSDADVKARYDELVKQNGGGKELHLHHILVDNEQAGQGSDRQDQGRRELRRPRQAIFERLGIEQDGGDLDWVLAFRISAGIRRGSGEAEEG